MKFDQSKLMNGDILAVRSTTSFGKAIRGVLGSYTNHDALFIRDRYGWCIGEAVSPVSKLTNLSDYEAHSDEGYELRVLRMKAATAADRTMAANHFRTHLLDKKYPLSVARLWVYRFVNHLPWKIKGDWCTRLVWDAWTYVLPDCLDRPDGKKKKNPTPRTIENRLIAGVLQDVTDSVTLHEHLTHDD